MPVRLLLRFFLSVCSGLVFLVVGCFLEIYKKLKQASGFWEHNMVKRRAVLAVVAALLVALSFLAALTFASVSKNFLFTEKLALGESTISTYPGIVHLEKDVTYLGNPICRLAIDASGGGFENASFIRIDFRIDQLSDLRVDSVMLNLSSSVHQAVFYQPDFYLAPMNAAASHPTTLYLSPEGKVVMIAKNLSELTYTNSGYYQQFIFTTIPNLSETLELYFDLSVAMHKESIIQLTSLKLDEAVTLNANKLYLEF